MQCHGSVPVRSLECIERVLLGLQYTAEPLLGAGLAFALLGERCASNAHGHLTSIVTCNIRQQVHVYVCDDLRVFPDLGRWGPTGWAGAALIVVSSLAAQLGGSGDDAAAEE